MIGGWNWVDARPSQVILGDFMTENGDDRDEAWEPFEVRKIEAAFDERGRVQYTFSGPVLNRYLDSEREHVCVAGSNLMIVLTGKVRM